MPRYLVQRTFADGLSIPTDAVGARACLGVINKNMQRNVTWVHSYVTKDLKNTFCIYDGPDQEAIKDVAERNGMGVDRITEVSVLDPYFYHPQA